MNYTRAYCNLIRRAEDRPIPPGYTERHHVFPKSIFGNNDRLVVLTGREHYIAHLLLQKICERRYGVESKRTQKMLCAHINMKSKGRYYNSYLYETAKVKRSRSMCGPLHWNWKGGVSRPRSTPDTNNNYIRHNYRIVSPEGNEYITNRMGAFCKEHNLSKANLCKVAHGQRPHHKKWIAEILSTY